MEFIYLLSGCLIIMSVLSITGVVVLLNKYIKLSKNYYDFQISCKLDINNIYDRIEENERSCSTQFEDIRNKKDLLTD